MQAILSWLAQRSQTQIAIEARVLRMPVVELDRINRDLAGGNLVLDREAADAVEQVSIAGGDVALIATARSVFANGQRGYVVAYRHPRWVDPPATESSDAPPLPLDPPADEEEGDDAEPAESTVEESIPSSIIIRVPRPEQPEPPSRSLNARTAMVLDIEVVATPDGDSGGEGGGKGGGGGRIGSGGPIIVTFRGDIATADPTTGPGLLQWRSTVRLPNGGGVLLTASTPAAPATQPADATPMETVLFLRARVVAAE